MSELIERLARVLCECAGSNPDEPVVMLSKPSGKGLRWEFHVPAARAAIEAMREPTQPMFNAMMNQAEGVLIIWYAGIDEALR